MLYNDISNIRESNNEEDKDKRNGFVISLVVHLLLLLLFFLPFIQKLAPQIPEIGGVMIVFGDPDAGMDTNEATEESASAQSSIPQEVTSSTLPTTSTEISTKELEAEAPIKAKPKTTPETKPKELSKAESDAKAKAKADSELKSKADAEKANAAKVAKEKADKEAKEKAEFNNKKKQFSDLLGGGKGNNGKSGNEGNPKGDPDGKALDGISKGSGRVGGGLSGRGILHEPNFSDSSQKTGKVALAICVGSNGKVTKADFTQKGSTTSDAYLIDLARKTAMKYEFSKSDIESQCGTVTVDFKVQ